MSALVTNELNRASYKTSLKEIDSRVYVFDVSVCDIDPKIYHEKTWNNMAEPEMDFGIEEKYLID